MTLTRIYRFAASHRLHSPQLSPDENAELYGKCNNAYGHGHDYVLHISVTGPTDAETGKIIGITALDRYVEDRVLRLYDHRDFNRDVPGFIGVPTTENVARDTQRRLCAGWPFAPAALDRILIEETGRNKVELRQGEKRIEI